MMAENQTVVNSVVGDRITRDVNDMVRVGGVCIGRVIEKDGVMCLEVLDRMKTRVAARGDQFVYATLTALVDVMMNIPNEGEK